MLQSKTVMEDKRVRKEYAPYSGVCAVFVKKKGKLLTFSNYKK